MLKQPTVTKLVNDAERDGLVRKSTDPTDKRRLVISLTPVGRRLALRLMAEARKAEDRTTDNIGQQEITRLKARLKKLIDDFDPSDGGAI
jgi:DNA-binding MarR family transcriptional regulator